LMEELIVDSQETAVRINIMIVLRVNKPIIDEPSNWHVAHSGILEKKTLRQKYVLTVNAKCFHCK
jgi:hypothetical protein